MKKTVSFKNPVRPSEPADSWVASRGADTEAPIVPAAEPELMKRFTIDVQKAYTLA